MSSPLFFLRRVVLGWIAAGSLLGGALFFLGGAYPIMLRPHVAVPLVLTAITGIGGFVVPVAPMMLWIVLVSAVGLGGVVATLAAGGGSILFGAVLAYLASASFAIAGWFVRPPIRNRAAVERGREDASKSFFDDPTTRPRSSRGSQAVLRFIRSGLDRLALGKASFVARTGRRAIAMGPLPRVPAY
jgi:hypothetical protein